MNRKKIINNVIKVCGPLCLGGAILYWMYRGLDWNEFQEALSRDMDWTWMLLSIPFGMLAQIFRALRWRQMLEPLNEKPRINTCVNSIFLSYASSLVVPRVGEVLRCGVLLRYEKTPFTKALGTVVTERIVDSVLVLLIALVALLLHVRVFTTFFEQTGVSLTSLLGSFTTAGYWVAGGCLLVAIGSLFFLLRRLSFFNKTKSLLKNLTEGLLSLRKVNSISLFSFYSLGIWASYFLHFYLTFNCFSYTENLGPMVALVAFVVGCFAVLVPTPNGAGPWHFAVKTILMLYGVTSTEGVIFVLIVHTLQTFLVLILGVYSIIALQLTRRKDQIAVNG